MTKIWVSSPKFTGQVDVIDMITSTKDAYGNVTDGPVWQMIKTTPPVWKKFTGQPFTNLVTWLMKFGKVEVEAL